MFENIICQPELVRTLTNDIINGQLPSALLLWGPDFSGKLSVALELARILSCEEQDARWSCGCKACEAHRLLVHPHTLLAGGRYFYEEAAACAGSLRKTGALPARYLFIRAVRKLLRRFDSFLWEADPNLKRELKKVMPHLSVAEDALEELLPEKEIPPANRLASLMETTLEAVKKICADVNLDSIPIALLREVCSWSHIGASGAAKIIIIENADRMLDAARNSLLKILEEPPPRTSFILTTTRRAAILPTILSRVRTFRFLPRDAEASGQVLKKIFREDSPDPAANLRDFFQAFQGIDSTALKAQVRTFISRALSGEDFPLEDETWFTDKTKFRVFLRELTGALRLILAGEYGAAEARGLPKVSLEKLEKWTAFVRQTRESLEAVNIKPSILAQRMALVMREA